MKPKLLYQGAEAVILKEKGKIIKDRISKSYRHPEIDKKIRKRRTKAESKILAKASELIPVPKLLSPLSPRSTDQDFALTMDFIKGKRLSDHLAKIKNYKTICKQIGKNLTMLHDAGIIHGDLTTSNMILKDKKVYFIDFGLSFHSNRIEDKAIDLHLISEALEAKHASIHEQAFKSILDGYKSSKNYEKTIRQLKKVESRGRYKAQY